MPWKSVVAKVTDVFCGSRGEKIIRVLHEGNNNKCRSYALFKSQELRQESYLCYVSDVCKRKLLSRFRLGVSVLRTETGRYEHNGFPGVNWLPLEWRICLCYDLTKLEDEVHFLIECPCYAKMRERLLSKVMSELKLNHTFFLSLPSDAIFMFIMESQDKVIFLKGFFSNEIPTKLNAVSIHVKTTR